MDSSSFDRLTRLVASSPTRRALGGGVLGSLIAVLGFGEVEAAPCPKGKKRCKKKCIPRRNCCTNSECRPAATGRVCKGGRCQCPPASQGIATVAAFHRSSVVARSVSAPRPQVAQGHRRSSNVLSGRVSAGDAGLARRQRLRCAAHRQATATQGRPVRDHRSSVPTISSSRRPTSAARQPASRPRKPIPPETAPATARPVPRPSRTTALHTAATLSPAPASIAVQERRAGASRLLSAITAPVRRGEARARHAPVVRTSVNPTYAASRASAAPPPARPCPGQVRVRPAPASSPAFRALGIVTATRSLAARRTQTTAHNTVARAIAHAPLALPVAASRTLAPDSALAAIAFASTSQPSR